MTPADVAGSEKPTRTLPPELDQFKEAVLQLDPGPNRDALINSISVATTQLQKLRDLEATQERLAREYGVDLSQEAENATPATVLGSEEVLNVHEIFTVTDVLDTDHIRGLAWQAQMPPEAVRKELRAFQKSVAERLAQAVRRTGNAKGAQDGAVGALQQHPARPVSVPGVGQGSSLVDDPEAAAAARATMFVKLAKLVSPDTGGIMPTPISTVGVFQQLMVGCGDWSVRCALLQALGSSGPEVLGRVVESSRVLDALHTWLQEALDDGQGTVLRLLLGVMGQLPVSRVMLRGSRLESGLESLARGAAGAGPGPGPAAGSGAAEGDGGGALAALRRRFGAVAAAVLEAWRQGTAVPLGRATSAHGPAPGLASTSTTTAAVPGTAGGAAVDAVPRKRLLDGRLAPAPVGRTNGDARGAPRPRVQDAPVGALPSSGAAAASAGAGGGGAAGGVHHPQQQQQRGAAGTAAAGAAAGLAARRAAGSGSGQGLRTAGAGAGVVGGAGSAAAAGAGAAAGAAAGPTKPDMTAKLGDTGPVDPDVVLGFRSRTGEVRRSQLAGRLAGRAGQPPAAANAAIATAGTGPGMGGGGGALGGPHGDMGYDLPQQQQQQGAGAGGAGGGGAGAMDVDADGLGEVDRAELERLRAERRAQRQAAGTLAAVQGEARRLPEVVAAERAYRDRAEALRKARALQLVAETQRRTSERAAAVAMRPTVAPWPRPPLELLLPPDQQPLAMGEDSTERQAQLAARQHTPKASYATSDAVPPSPAEPPAPDPPAPPARPFPWLPSADEEDGPADWYRQNLQAWEAGTRMPDYALPPALLHKHLRLDPRVVAPPPTPAPPQPLLPAQPQHQQLLPPHRPSPPPATLLPAAAAGPAAPLMLQAPATTLMLQQGPPGAPLILVLQPGTQGTHQQAVPMALQQPPAPGQQQGWWPQDGGQQQQQQHHHPQHVSYGQQDYRPAADPYYAPTNGRAGYDPVSPQGQGAYEQPYTQRGPRPGRYPDEWPPQQQQHVQHGPPARGPQGYGGRADEGYYDAPAAEYYGGPGEGTVNGYGTGRRDVLPYRQQQQRAYEAYEPVGPVHHSYPAQDQRGYGRHNRR